MPRKRISLNEHKNKILWILHSSIAEEEDKIYEISDFNTEFNIPSTIVELAINQLQEEQLCSVRIEEIWEQHPFTGQDIKHDEKYITLTPYGISTVEEWADEFYNNVVQNVFSKLPESKQRKYFSVVSGVDEPLVTEIPASDRYVTISHNQQYEDTLRTLDDAIRQFKEDNHFDNELGQEKGALVAALEGGRQLLNDTKIWIATANNLLVESLRRIKILYKRAAVQGAVSAVVNSALEKILKLLGLE